MSRPFLLDRGAATPVPSVRPPLKVKRLVWITNTLHTAGGGTRLLFEGIQYYKSIGIDAHIITWDFDEEALFGGTYSRDSVHIIGDKHSASAVRSTFNRAATRVGTFGRLRRLIAEINPDIVLNQSEYDCTLLYLALRGTRYEYATLIFGQMFQAHEDTMKYALMYRRHFNAIRSSTPGYQELVPLQRPKTGALSRLTTETLGVARYPAMRNARRIFVFSKQVQWENHKLYGVSSIIAKGAFPRAIVGKPIGYPIDEHRDRPGQKIILSLCRLIRKKRVDLKLRAFHQCLERGTIGDAKLLIGGKGEDYDQLVALAGDLKLGDRVKFLGFVPDADVYPLTAACDSYMSLDVADFDISPFEALALKRPVIWSSEMDTDDFLSSCPAVFAVPPTVDAVADAIKKSLALDLTAVDWSGVDHYSWEAYFQGILDAIEAGGGVVS
jgi:glycosyltransferase involved in cell wall biosynthesis